MNTGTEPIDVQSASMAELKEAVANKRGLIGITSFGTHNWPDVDELSAIAIIQMLGGHVFPSLAGKKYLSLCVITQDEVLELGEDAWYKLLQEGCLAIGIAGGPFDDHGQGEKTSAMQKVAEFLGVEKTRWLKQLLDYVNQEDNSGEKEIPNGFSSVTGPEIKATWRLFREDGRDKDEMVREAEYFIRQIKKHLVDQRRFQEAVKQIKKNRPEMIPLGKSGRSIAVIKSDSERVVGAIRYVYCRYHDLAVIVQIKPSGNFQIHPAKEGAVSREEMDEVASALRFHFISWVNRGLSAKKKVKMSRQESCMDGAQENTRPIYYYRDAGMIYNGSLTQSQTMGIVGEDESRLPFNHESLVNTVVSALIKGQSSKPKSNEDSVQKVAEETASELEGKKTDNGAFTQEGVGETRIFIKITG